VSRPNSVLNRAAIVAGYVAVAGLLPAAAPVTTIPFVGCESDGGGGHIDAASGVDLNVNIDAQIGSRLAYYRAADGHGVLGPRGWSCFGFYGSSGWTLYIAPRKLDVAERFTVPYDLTRPVIQMTESIGDTSGRFTVARVIARVFPSEKDFVQRVVAEGLVPVDDFPLGPFPRDKLTYRSDRLVEYETPPNAYGLGTESRLQPDDQPIRGTEVLLGPEPSLASLAVRLPPNLADLVPIIISQVERDILQP
jgi:hypothetical protein